MKRVFIVAMFLPLGTFAQQIKPLQFNWNISTAQKAVYTPLVLYKPLLEKPLMVEPIRYILPKAAIFCRMEDAFYKRFNVLVKVRMGTDDRYSN